MKRIAGRRTIKMHHLSKAVKIHSGTCQLGMFLCCAEHPFQLSYLPSLSLSYM